MYAVIRKEGLLYADSPTKPMWGLGNELASVSKAAPVPVEDPDDDPSFTGITLDVKY